MIHPPRRVVIVAYVATWGDGGYRGGQQGEDLQLLARGRRAQWDGSGASSSAHVSIVRCIGADQRGMGGVLFGRLGHRVQQRLPFYDTALLGDGKFRLGRQ